LLLLLLLLLLDCSQPMNQNCTSALSVRIPRYLQGSGFISRLSAFFVGVGVGAAGGAYYLVLPEIEKSTSTIVTAVEASSTCK
jgi:hypothetical protein